MPYRIRVPGMEIGSFRQHLAADGKVTKTIRLYTEAVAWSAAAPLIGEVRKTNWEQAGQQACGSGWPGCSAAITTLTACNQYRALDAELVICAELRCGPILASGHS